MLQVLDNNTGPDDPGVAPQRQRNKSTTALPLKALVVGDAGVDLDALCASLARLKTLDVKVTRAQHTGAIVEALLHERFDAIIVRVTGDAERYTQTMPGAIEAGSGPLRIVLVDPDAAKPSAQMIAADAVSYINRNEFTGQLLEKTILDALESRRMERDLREANVALERAQEQRGEYFSRVAHALRLPLLDILKRSDALAARARDVNTRETELADARSIFESSLQALDLINELVNDAENAAMATGTGMGKRT